MESVDVDRLLKVHMNVHMCATTYVKTCVYVWLGWE